MYLMLLWPRFDARTLFCSSLSSSRDGRHVLVLECSHGSFCARRRLVCSSVLVMDSVLVIVIMSLVFVSCFGTRLGAHLVNTGAHPNARENFYWYS